VGSIGEPTLRALCLRLADTKLGDNEWLESVASFVCEKPPAKWVDADVDQFGEQIGHLARRFRRIQAMHFPSGQATSAALLRVAITKPDGVELDRVLQVSPDEEELVRAAEERIAPVLRQFSGRIGIVAATRALMRELARNERESQKEAS
jgi:methylphosphotriester-DNA--protein-cysteine methyltransferase